MDSGPSRKALSRSAATTPDRRVETPGRNAVRPCSLHCVVAGFNFHFCNDYLFPSGIIGNRDAPYNPASLPNSARVMIVRLPGTESTCADAP